MRFMVTWKANGSVWPTDPKQKLAVMEMAIAGGNQLREMGMIKDIGWLRPRMAVRDWPPSKSRPPIWCSLTCSCR